MSDYFKHHFPLVESEYIGEGTRIWAFADVMVEAKMYRNCNIGDHCFVGPGPRIRGYGCRCAQKLIAHGLRASCQKCRRQYHNWDKGIFLLTESEQ